MFIWMPLSFGTLVAMQVYQTALWLACTGWWCACLPGKECAREDTCSPDNGASLQS